jgi:hypothetical protein
MGEERKSRRFAICEAPNIAAAEGLGAIIAK